ncbi:MAG: hypothetical protein GPJ54_06850 [Candidatus Heimdallarchaeota archaeon]|nr:hypothetical protein [Candidatus Heimdallarchaeota archaeon]
MAVQLFNSKTQNQQINKRENTFYSIVSDKQIGFETDFAEESRTNSSSYNDDKINIKPKYIADILHHQHILKLIK